MFSDGRLWEEAAEVQEGHPLHRTLVSLVVMKDDDTTALIGTAFIVEARGRRALAISAAHCFDEIGRLVQGERRAHPTALTQFLPPVQDVDLDNVRAFYAKGNNAAFCFVEIAAWDRTSDLAMLEIAAPRGLSGLFKDQLAITEQVPSLGDPVVLVGYGEMKITDETEMTPIKGNTNRSQRTFTLNRRLITRVGTITEVFPDGQILLRSRCLQTTVPVFFGMSGGLAARWTGEDTQIEPFGFISHAPEPQPLEDRSRSGDSVISIFDVKVSYEDEYRYRMTLKNIGVGRNSKPPRPGSRLLGR
ncbi:hypothetical protein MA20_34970 [Bradyrhizobium japonicum]|uniref:Peptidase S1 domain-containing protein n=1 Tax=Bradyrhizobium japonicum TaxID=375 RepID=A0A0A3XQ03_BRAJP|nr:trypsin-like peptidase domain-containing protein [Bradyrhizobium japonicum]KGT75241.1 hypothetical protein MA20_34970 [Bradyrhizobium japonicum]